MKFSEVKDLNKEDLVIKVTQATKDLFELKMKHSLGQISNPLKIRDLRKSIAKLKTAINSKK